MIVTLTAHPSLDRTVTLGAPLRVGEVQAATASREDAGGKGINVARVVSAARHACVAVLPLAADDPFDAALRASGLDARRVPVGGHVRANLAVTDPSGVTTKLNLPGAMLSPDEQSALVDAVVTATGGAHWLVLAGSLPPGTPDDFYVRVIDAVREEHGEAAPRIAVDTSGSALATVVEGAAPELVKPNDDELAELMGGAIGDDPASVLDAARSLVPVRAGAALVTLGGRGALLVERDGAWLATPPPIRVTSTVGAGDSSLAGYVLADTLGLDAEERLRRAVRYGAAAASLPGTQAPTPADLPTGDIPVIRLF